MSFESLLYFLLLCNCDAVWTRVFPTHKLIFRNTFYNPNRATALTFHLDLAIYEDTFEEQFSTVLASVFVVRDRIHGGGASLVYSVSVFGYPPKISLF